MKTINMTAKQITDQELRDLITNNPDCEELVLTNTPITDISCVAELKNLKKLDLWCTQVSDISVLAHPNLQGLIYLRLSELPITSLSMLEGLQYLQELYLTGVPISDIQVINKLTALEVLTLDSTAIKHDLSPLRSLVKLRELYLGGLDLVPKDLNPLKGLPALECIVVDEDEGVEAARDKILKQAAILRKKTDLLVPSQQEAETKGCSTPYKAGSRKALSAPPARYSTVNILKTSGEKKSQLKSKTKKPHINKTLFPVL